MSLKLKCKPGVLWHVHPAIDAAQDTIIKAFREQKVVATCTSAKDGAHSFNSAHNQADTNKEPARAIDLRIWGLFPKIKDPKEWWRNVYSFAGELSMALNTTPHHGFSFIVVCEKDHLHVEAYANGTRPNVKGFNPIKTVYMTADVEKSIA